ncbi:MAG TPA: hypothetical protein VMA36_15325 [Candidatus Limnocylindria bacterium]|jgi:NADH:ubiquinone oxidoreductase subunit 6 (subunit J)|nr:hypothetical protein [Candidatus Limnocylindria bacterium]
MGTLLDYPLLLFLLAVVVLWLSAQAGRLASKRRKLQEGRDDLGIVLAATLTLLGLIIGFSFSMATNRYDQRKNYEEAEANAIGTEYVRADLLRPADAATAKRLLRTYLDERIRFYDTRDRQQLQRIAVTRARLQDDLWSVVRGAAHADRTPVVALVVSGMNDVLNAQGYTQAAWWNRIPISAWVLMFAIAICSNALIGYSAHGVSARSALFLVLPVVVSIAFLLIADIDSPRGGFIHVGAQNLVSLAEALRRQ